MDAIEATNTITRIVEQTLSQEEIVYCQIHIIPAMFAAMGIHAIDICDGQPNSLKEQLGYVKLRMCMIALKEVREIWPLSGWIFLLFTRIVKRIRDKDYQAAQTNSNIMPASTQPINSSTSVPQWQSGANPPWNATAGPDALSSFLTMPLDFSADWADILAMDNVFDLDGSYNM
jgi:hypothetical protein